MLHDAVLLYSDQQSFIGIAILTSGFSQLPCSLSTYHWQLTFDLAWFSSITHLTTLTCLRHYFQKRPVLRIWRLICMALTGVMLATSLFSIGYIQPFSTDVSYPAWCLYHPNISDTQSGVGPYNGWYVGITFGFLTLSYLSRAIQLFPTAIDMVYRCFRAWPSLILQVWLKKLQQHASDSSSRTLRIFWALLYRGLFPVWCVFEASADLWSSLLWEVNEN